MGPTVEDNWPLGAQLSDSSTQHNPYNGGSASIAEEGVGRSLRTRGLRHLLWYTVFYICTTQVKSQQHGCLHKTCMMSRPYQLPCLHTRETPPQKSHGNYWVPRGRVTFLYGWTLWNTTNPKCSVLATYVWAKLKELWGCICTCLWSIHMCIYIINRLLWTGEELKEERELGRIDEWNGLNTTLMYETETINSETLKNKHE